MDIELGRHDWGALRSFADSRTLPGAIRALTAAEDEDSARAAYWRIDGVAISDGCLTQSTPAVAAVLVQALTSMTVTALPYALELLVQISGGYVHEPVDQGLGPVSVEECIQEIALAFPFYCELLEQPGQVKVRGACIDLIASCGIHIGRLRARAVYLLTAVRNLPEMESNRVLIENSLNEFD